MTGWVPFLNTRASVSSKLEDGTGYGGFSNYVHSAVLAEEPDAVRTAKELLPKMHLLPEADRCRIPRALFVKDGHVHILEFGYLRTRLGEDFAYGMNGTRSIPYTYGLSAPLGTPIPSLGELDRRGEEIRTELGRLVTAINERRDVQAEARRFEFAASDHGDSLWDTTAKSIMGGESPKKVIITELAHLKPEIDELVPGAVFEGSKKNFARTPPPEPHIQSDIPLGEAHSTGPSHSSSSGKYLTALVAFIVVFSGVWTLAEIIRRVASARDEKSARR